MANDLKGQVMHLMAGNMSCQELVDLMTEYLEGSLPFTDRIRFQIHLGFCVVSHRPQCTSCLDNDFVEIFTSGTRQLGHRPVTLILGFSRQPG